MATVRSSS